MRNKKLAAFAAVFIILGLAACSNSEEKAAFAEDAALQETSSGELLVDSLEYLLDRGGVFRQEEDKSDEEAEQDAREEEESAGGKVAVYYGNGASDELEKEMLPMEQVTAENLVDALIKHNIISLGTKVNSFEEQESDGVKTLYLDLSKAFREYLRTMTQEGEHIIMSSVTATFLEAYDAQKIIITVDGDALETDYEMPEASIDNGAEQE